MAEKSDGLILLVTTDQVPRSLPKESINRSLESGSTLLGIISNSTKKSSNKFLNKSGYGNYAYVYNAYNEEDTEENIPNKKSRLNNVKDSLLSNLSEINSKFFKMAGFLNNVKF